MSSRIPEPESAFEAEGIPDMGYSLDQEEITGDTAEGMEPPHDTPIAVDDYGTTAREEREGEPLDLRISREEPDVLAAVDTPADETDGASEPFGGGAGGGVGRLVEPDEGARGDDEPDAVGRDAGTDLGGFTAEEAAMRIEPET